MWTELKAPSLAEMEATAHDIFERLPAQFRKLCEGVIIRVDDFPTEEVLDEMECESEFDLLGLFQGVGLPQQSFGDVARLPNFNVAVTDSTAPKYLLPALHPYSRA